MTVHSVHSTPNFDTTHGTRASASGVMSVDVDRSVCVSVQLFVLVVLVPVHVLEHTRGDNVLDLILSSNKELVDNVTVEPLGTSVHSQIHFNLTAKTGSR